MTNKNSIQEEIKCRLKAGNSCYYSVQTHLSSRLFSKNLKIKIYKTIILLSLGEECRLRVFENMILRQIFGPKRNTNEEWRRFHNEELRGLYRSPNIVRVIKSRRLSWADHVARIEEGRSDLKIVTGKPT